jgi:predicted phosphohydrolase
MWVKSIVRLLVTADLHCNHPRSRELAENLIEQMNQAGGDVLLVVGDTATGDGRHLEQALERFRFSGPKLLVAGNHELWTSGSDSYELYTKELPRRVAAIGWHWLDAQPWVCGDIAIAGNVGWYDYTFARAELGIPRRFYERKVSPGVAARLAEYRDLQADSDDVAPAAREIVARWNDGTNVKLGRSDEQFAKELLGQLERHLKQLNSVKTIVAAIHCLPFAELLPPSHRAQWDFAKAYLGSARIGEMLLGYPNVKRVYCGHSHWKAETHVGHIHSMNIGSGYRTKLFRIDDLS